LKDESLKQAVAASLAALGLARERALRSVLGVLLLLGCASLALAPLGAQAQATPAPVDGQGFQSPLEPPTLTATATGTATPTPTPTATFTPLPTETPTPTIAPLQVSPLIAQDTTALPDDGALLWIGAAGLLMLAGSAVLLVAERRQKR
jgi:hypothetical protein